MTGMTPQDGAGLPARERLIAAAELVLAMALVFGANVLDIVPVSETPWLVLVGWLSLRLRGLGWRSVGFTRPASWPRTIAVALVAAVVLQLASEYVVEPLVERWTGETPDLSQFRPLIGNLPAALGMLVLVWVLAAFGEELAYRGYVLERAATLGHGTPAAWVLAMVVISVLFGVGHVYQGAAGVASSTFAGLYLGGLYLATRRNLWLPILTHGFSDTIAVAVIFLGLVEI